MAFEERLKPILEFQHCELVGCRRQNRLAPIRGQWRFAKGLPLLICLGGEIVRLKLCPSPCDTVITPDGWVLTYRAGREVRPWWLEDLQLLTALAFEFSGRPVRGGVLVQGLDTGVIFHQVPVPGNTAALVEAAVMQERIRHTGPRGLVSCPVCPVQRECYRLDLLNRQTQDWSSTWREYESTEG